MKTSKTLLFATIGLSLVASFAVSGQSRSGYAPERTPWGHPDLQGTYSNDDETGTPMERPAEFEGRSHESLTTEELNRIVADRNERFVDGVSGDQFAGGPQRPNETTTPVAIPIASSVFKIFMAALPFAFCP